MKKWQQESKVGKKTITKGEWNHIFTKRTKKSLEKKQKQKQKQRFTLNLAAANSPASLGLKSLIGAMQPQIILLFPQEPKFNGFASQNTKDLVDPEEPLSQHKFNGNKLEPTKEAIPVLLLGFQQRWFWGWPRWNSELQTMKKDWNLIQFINSAAGFLGWKSSELRNNWIGSPPRGEWS